MCISMCMLLCVNSMQIIQVVPVAAGFTKKLFQQFSTPKEAEKFFLQQVKLPDKGVSGSPGQPTEAPESSEDST